MNTKLTLILFTLSLSACGSSDNKSDEPTANANPGGSTTDEQPIITANADNPLSNPDAAPASSDASGVDSGTAKTYNNAYGPNFCDLESSSLDCWGDVALTYSAHAEKLYMSQHAICYSKSGYGTGDMSVECYSNSLGPIVMDPHKVSGFQNSSRQTIANVTVNNSGQVCFKVEEWSHTNTIHAIYYPCGSEPTAQGGLQ